MAKKQETQNIYYIIPSIYSILVWNDKTSERKSNQTTILQSKECKFMVTIFNKLKQYK